MGAFDWFLHRWQQEARRYKYVEIDPAHVRLAGGGTPQLEPLVAGNHYFRLWLVEMLLRNDREWFTNWHPAVHAAINFRFGDQDEAITRVAGQTFLPDLGSENLNRVIALNYQLTPLLPFNGGVVELSAGLLAIAGKNEIKSFLKVLGDFSNLLMVPQLSTALAIATPLANGLAELVGATDSRLVLGVHNSWSNNPAQLLRAGYVAVILAEDDHFKDGEFFVVKNRLQYGETIDSSKPLTGRDYMLFQIERQTERDDWDSLNAIQDPYAKAIEMLRIGNTEQADAYIRTAKAAAFTAKELTRNVDQRRVLTQLDKRYAEAKEVLQQNAFADSDTSLTTAMQDAMHPAEASAAGSVLPEDFGLDGLSRT